MRRQFKPQETTEQEIQSGTTTLPVHRACVVYARQSTTKQTVENLESARYQTEGLYQKALRLGWTDDLITLMVEGQQDDGTLRGVSGSLRIDQRAGLSVVVLGIKNGEIAAILVANESRLFRDETGIEYNIFVELCRTHNMVIITDHFTYNFARPFDVKLFRMQCEAASDYVTYHVRGVLHPLRRQAALRGQYDGRAVAPGYIVDYDKESPTYKKYIVYSPHAKVIVWIFCRYRELGGSLWKLGRELEALPYAFPAFEAGVKPSKLLLLPKKGGYGVGRTALISILTNPVYIGHWMLEERIVRYNNHEAIVSDDDFFYAFKRLSAVTLDGDENSEKPEPQSPRYTQRGKPESPALLKEIITSPHGTVRTIRERDWTYCIEKPRYGFSSPHMAVVSVRLIDGLFIERLRNFLAWQHLTHLLLQGADENDGVAEIRRLDSAMRAQAQAMRPQQPVIDYDEQIARYNKLLDGKLATLDLSPEDLDALTRAKVAREVKGLRSAIVDLEQKKADAKRVAETLQESSDLFAQAFHDLDGMSLERKRRLISIVARRVSIGLASAHWLKIEIDWRGPASYTDTGYLYRTKSASSAYSEQEDALLREMYPNGERDAILHKLPHRTWNGIRWRAEELGLHRSRPKAASHESIPFDVSLDDWTFMKETGIAQEDFHTGFCHWRRSLDDNDEQSRRCNVASLHLFMGIAKLVSSPASNI